MSATMMTLGFFVGGGETMVKDFESRIVSASAQSGHVEHVTNWQPRGHCNFSAACPLLTQSGHG